ncbi:hypothetical protein GCM10010339_93840 [Streptomyces alanosinicus]|uniref:Uncharacterized protein n=1 Tax=Streptomyces alanosinicus TaxID=68171 RepID=A0A918MI35_9ACTN|nr:hypothetical protein GCM10010339_93840 [Streptomyces alanosinicus]
MHDSELHAALRPRQLNMELTIDVLDRIGVFLDGRTAVVRDAAGTAPAEGGGIGR